MTEIRPAVPDDLASVVAVYNRAHPEDAPSSVEILQWTLDRADPARPHAHLVAVVDTRIAGRGYLRGIPEMESLVLNIEVDPDHRRRGIGTELLAGLLRVTRDEPRALMAVSESSASGIAFAEHRGFTEESRRYESELNLQTFDPAPFAEERGVLDEAGIRFTTLAEEDSPQLRRRLYRLVQRLTRDVPTPEPVRPVSYKEWERDWIDVPFASPATFALALFGDRPIALSYLVMEADGSGYNWMTGVARDYRGHGLGLAVKVEALRLAKNRGVPFVRTNNDLTNAPMLAVNKQLGYQLRPGVIGFGRNLKDRN
jgi:ribosomal protein S18 acetylase RimI-like enzyme